MSSLKVFCKFSITIHVILMNQLFITQIRSLTGPILDSVFYTKDPGQEGLWNYDPSDSVSADNNGSILVTADGK